jgi:hypothetical protein
MYVVDVEAVVLDSLSSLEDPLGVGVVFGEGFVDVGEGGFSLRAFLASQAVDLAQRAGQSANDLHALHDSVTILQIEHDGFHVVGELRAGPVGGERVCLDLGNGFLRASGGERAAFRPRFSVRNSHLFLADFCGKRTHGGFVHPGSGTCERSGFQRVSLGSKDVFHRHASGEHLIQLLVHFGGGFLDDPLCLLCA